MLERQDLLRKIPYGPTPLEVRAFDFATQHGQLFLGPGWSEGEAEAGSGVRLVGRGGALLSVPLVSVAERTVVALCRALGAGGEVTAVLRWNGRQLGRERVGREWQNISVPLPRRAQRVGRNELRILAFGGTIGCRHVEIHGGRASGEVSELREGSDGQLRLFLPAGSEARVYVFPRGRSFAVLAAENEARVRVETESQSGKASVAYSGRLGRKPRRVRLAVSPGEPYLLRLRALDALELVQLSLEEEFSVAQAAPRAGGARPDILLYVVDTLRRDRLGVYGNRRGITPRLDSFAREAVVFGDAVAQSSWTRPSVASLLTGVSPLRHGAVRLRSGISPEVRTLAEILREKGYATAGFVTNIHVASRWGFGRGFGTYAHLEEDPDSEEVHVPAPELHRRALGWVEGARRPFFLYLHATDPHAPYTPADAFARRYAKPAPPGATRPNPRRNLPLALRPAWAAWLSSLYDAEVAEFDESFGSFVEELRRRRLLDGMVFVFVSDHGEEFAEHGEFGHGHTLYGEVVRIPLLVRLPEARFGGRRVSGLASHVDVFATILELAGGERRDGLGGRSLLPAIEGGATPLRPCVLHSWLGRDELFAWVFRRWKVVVRKSAGIGPPRVEVYDRSGDPGERRNLAREWPFLVDFVRQEREALSAGAAEAKTEAVLDAATIERLRALGYGTR